MRRLSYDEIASDFENIFVPRVFVGPANDLVGAMEISPGSLVLDVGSGTGAVSVPCRRALGDRGTVIALDLSPAMLRHQVKKEITTLVIGEAPQLPFSDEMFDRILAGFVVAHFRDYKTCLRDMVRVLCPGGRMGATAWHLAENPYLSAWNEAVDEFVDQERKARIDKDVPWEEWFSDPKNFESSLREAGLADVMIVRKEYPVAMSKDEYLLMRRSAMSGRRLREALGEPEWQRFTHRVDEEFKERFGERVDYTSSAFLAIGSKPPSS
jgi:ubiquinone/menaquinone biosynthesis C-methylase UbiE